MNWNRSSRLTRKKCIATCVCNLYVLFAFSLILTSFSFTFQLPLNLVTSLTWYFSSPNLKKWTILCLKPRWTYFYTAENICDRCRIYKFPKIFDVSILKSQGSCRAHNTNWSLRLFVTFLCQMVWMMETTCNLTSLIWSRNGFRVMRHRTAYPSKSSNVNPAPQCLTRLLDLTWKALKRWEMFICIN